MWNTRQEATATSSLHQMRELEDTFELLGLVFGPIANYDTLWNL